MSESPPTLPRWKRHLYGLIAAEVSSLTRDCDRVGFLRLELGVISRRR